MADAASYLTINCAVGDGVDIEFEARRSRFLTRLRRVTDQESARRVIEARRREHFDARHHCSAFVIGGDGREARSSDDGEPAGTAGVPMMNVLQHHGVSDVVAVVTRYFGGIKLGAGGLVRAYSDAVARALDAIGTRRVVLSSRISIETPVTDAALLEDRLRGLTLPDGSAVIVEGVAWSETASLVVAVPAGSESLLQQSLWAMSSGRFEIAIGDQTWVDQTT